MATSVQAVLDKAVDRLPPLRKRIAKFRLRNTKYREQVCVEIAGQLAQDSEFLALFPQNFADSFDEKTEMQIDIEKLIELVLKYLPSILDLIFKLFAVLAFVFIMSLPTIGMAQDCANGQCLLPQKAATVVKQAANFVAPPYPRVQAYHATRTVKQRQFGHRLRRLICR